MATLAYWFAILWRFTHTSYHFLMLHWDNPAHFALNDIRWRGDMSVRSIELRCTCGRLFFKWWSEDK